MSTPRTPRGRIDQSSGRINRITGKTSLTAHAQRDIFKDESWRKMSARKIEVNRPTYLYPDNSIETSKYTCITFLAKNLLEQFSKLANLYFLVKSALLIITF